MKTSKLGSPQSMPRDLHVRMGSVIDSQTASSLLLVSSNWRKTKKAFLMINPASLNYVVLAPIPPSRHFQNLYRDFALSNFQRITCGRNRTSREQCYSASHQSERSASRSLAKVFSSRPASISRQTCVVPPLQSRLE